MNGNEKPRTLLDRVVFIGRINRLLRVPLASWGVIIFAGYYLVPLLICGVEGVLIGAPSGATHTNIRLAALIRMTGRRNASMPYLKDLTHLLMAVTVSIGGALCIVALTQILKVYNTISDPELIKMSATEIATERERMEKLLGSRTVLIPIALIAGSCGIALYFNGSADAGWWGNPDYGPAGILLGCSVSLVIFYGLHALYMLAVVQYSIVQLVSNGIHLRPFHPDSCNGFSRLGNLLLLLLLLCCFCVTAAWITIRHGYLGIEDFPGIWLAALGIVVFVPVIVIQPLIHITTQVRRAQLLRLTPVEQLLNARLKGTEEHLADPGASSGKLDEIKMLREFHAVTKDIYETSIFPFNRKVASALSIGYIVQAVALGREIIGKFK